MTLHFHEDKQKKREKSREHSQLSKNKRLQNKTDVSTLKCKIKVNFMEFRNQDEIEMLDRNIEDGKEEYGS